ncbi:DUF6928 family protein [Streptomyces spiralis]
MVRSPTTATLWGGTVGSRTGLLVYADGDVPELLRQVDSADLDRTTAMMRRPYPGWEIEECGGLESLGRRVPADGDGVRGRHRVRRLRRPSMSASPRSRGRWRGWSGLPGAW